MRGPARYQVYKIVDCRHIGFGTENDDDTSVHTRVAANLRTHTHTRWCIFWGGRFVYTNVGGQDEEQDYWRILVAIG